MGELPRHQSDLSISERCGVLRRQRFSWVFLALSIITLLYLPSYWTLHSATDLSERVPLDASHILSRCAEVKTRPGFPADFYTRTKSNRFQAGTRPTLIHNATIWTGEDSGKEQFMGDIFMDGGIIKWIGVTALEEVGNIYGDNVDIVDARGAWTTPGIVDMHSHLGVNNAPGLSAANDGNSHWGITQPWLRSLDGLNTHDEAFLLSISGGITSANVLPGSANAIGGQAYPIKLRPTTERSPSSKLIEPPGAPNTTGWRQMKHACGENPSRVYKGTRMDTIWSFRAAYNEARLLVQRQDRFCAAAEAGRWSEVKEFPEDLKWEALADVIRGKVKIHTHCYEAVDFDSIVRLSNEFKFPIAAFHHAHEAYLVPDLIKKSWGPTPAIAIFATNARYKREAYRGSEFASRILADNGLRVVMKSDHPVLDSRFLLYEAQQAHFYGLPADIALTSVTTTPADVLGLSHRIGYIKEGYDADIVLWDSHPLALGATPKQVYIDGIAQLAKPYGYQKEASFQKLPVTPDFDKEAAEVVEYEGLPPLAPSQSVKNAVFVNVRSVWSRVEGEGVEQTFDADNFNVGSRGEGTVVVVESGRITCTGTTLTCRVENLMGYEIVDLEGGSLAPGLTSFGAPLGLDEIAGEPSTKDGNVFDPLSGSVPAILGGDGAVIRAVDGLEFGTRDALLAYRSGVTAAISAPAHAGVFAGLGTLFSVGSANKMQKGAIVQDVTGLHVSIGHNPSGSPSISTQIATLRRLLLGNGEGEQRKMFKAAAHGKTTLVVNVEAANIMATLLTLKKEVEQETGRTMKMTFVGAAEAHLLAGEISQAGVGVVLIQSRPFPAKWQQRHSLSGPPLSEESAIAKLLAHGVTVGIGILESWNARNTRFDAAWAALESPNQVSKKQALALVSTHLEKLLGASVGAADTDTVAYRGGDAFELSSKVTGIISPRRGLVDLL
ncbi:composite domain of metallo-dependent hydrolase [Ramaria rubella]|nr:composite domain of metallo-dependent hydrolase [Ramaria rubella]